MAGWTYELHVCPFCGAPAEFDGGYEGYGWIFGACEHESFSEEYGSVDGLAVDVTGGMVAVGERIAGAVAYARPVLEAQRREKARVDAERRAREEARRAALTPEQREREDHIRAVERQAMRNVFGDLQRDYNRQVFGGDVSWLETAEIKVVPGSTTPTKDKPGS